MPKLEMIGLLDIKGQDSIRRLVLVRFCREWLLD